MIRHVEFLAAAAVVRLSLDLPRAVTRENVYKSDADDDFLQTRDGLKRRWHPAVVRDGRGGRETFASSRTNETLEIPLKNR